MNDSTTHTSRFVLRSALNMGPMPGMHLSAAESSREAKRLGRRVVPGQVLTKARAFAAFSGFPMTDLTLHAARIIVETALETARARRLKPLAVVVYDGRGALKCVQVEDGTSLRRAEIAMGKANGALALGIGSRAIAKRAEEQPHFVAAISHLAGPAALVPVPGGVLIRDGNGIVGAVGISGDTSDNDEVCAVAGIEAAGLSADTGA